MAARRLRALRGGPGASSGPGSSGLGLGSRGLGPGAWSGLGVPVLALLLALGARGAAAEGPSEHVPLIGWSTDSSVFPPPGSAPAAGGWVGEGRLLELLSPPLRRGPPTRLLFIMDQLSMDDFTLYGSALPNLQGALAGAGSSLVLGAVGGGAAGALPHTLPRALGAAPRRGDPDPRRGDPDPRQGDPDPLRGLNGSQPGLLVLRLPHSAGSSLLTPREALARNDAVLGEVLGALREQGLPHSALLTALRPSRVPPPKPPSPAMGRGRSLMGRDDSASSPPLPHPPLAWPRPPAAPQVLLWARNLSLERGGQRLDLTTRTFGGAADVTLGGQWDPQDATLELKYDDVFGETLRITLRFRRAWFAVSGRPWWWLRALGVALGGGGGAPGAEFRGGEGGMGAPSPLGWRCGEFGAPGPLLTPPDPPPALGVAFRDLQVQPFNVSGPFFGGASDCAAFFSGGAWMGVLSGGLLLGALLLGAGLLLGLRPMDRLDDPRGPPLPVPANE
ncbi:V-type proton ATPase subunit S1 [Patagioenas fasciata]|uniref:V-type proton ATPase subunit S1 n=1 Tax=Patagioenas fasciata TaxID=372321 RepID=UPI003A9A3FCC